MFEISFWIAIGIFIGWNIPAPSWSTTAFNWIGSKIKNLWDKFNDKHLKI